MATFETAHLGIEVFRWASNLRRNIRSNAQSYKARLDAGEAASEVASIADADAAEYLKTIAGLDVYISDAGRRAKLLDGLTVFGINQTEAADELSALRTAAEGQRDANKANATQIRSMADQILSFLVSYDVPERIQ